MVPPLGGATPAKHLAQLTAAAKWVGAVTMNVPSTAQHEICCSKWMQPTTCLSVNMTTVLELKCSMKCISNP
jgi:hypothetical protein